MRMTLIVVLVLLAGCTGKAVRDNSPPPEVVTVPVVKYVPIDGQLTKRCDWTRNAKPSQVFPVSNGRKRCLEQYEAQLDGIDRVQGKPVPDVQP